MEVYQIVIAILGGFVAGCINTLAGNGSAITLSILTEVMGLPGNMANGTNRIGVMYQAMVSSFTFHKHGKLKLARSKLLFIWVTIGAIIGVLVATQISNEQFLNVFKYLMLLMLVVILVNPKRWLIETKLVSDIPKILAIPLYLALGFYGGFIQMGWGILFLIIAVLIRKINITESNAIKSFIVVVYSVFVIAIFQYKGLLDWKIGSILGIGQMAGAFITARYASKYKGSEIWAYRLLVLIVIVVLLRMFGVLNLFL